MSDHCTTKDEICNLLKELKRNETKTTNDISDIYKNLDNIIKSNSKIRTRLHKSVTNVSEYTGGGDKFELDINFIKYIKSIQKRYKKDKNWYNDFINEMKYEKIRDFKTLKKNAKNDNELIPFLTKEYEINFEELLHYPKQQINRNYLIKAIEKINSKFNLVEKKDIYSISLEQLYKHLSSLIKKYKDKIPDKDINLILRNFDELDQMDYNFDMLSNIVEKKMKNHLTSFISILNIRLNNKRNFLENLKERVYADNIEYFLLKLAKKLKHIYHPSKTIALENLNRSGLGKKFFKILTDDGKIEVDDIVNEHSVILYGMLRDQYEEYLIQNNPIVSIHGATIPIGFIVRDIKSGYDSQFASIASCIDDDDVMKIISNKCTGNVKPSIKKFCKNLSKVRINAKNNFISSNRVDIAQQIIRELASNHVEEYMNYNPFVIQTLSILMDHKDATQYNELSLTFQTQSYHPYAQKNMGLSNTETKKVMNILKSLITESEYLNPDYVDNSNPVWWGDEITWNILSYVFYKYFGILLIYISGIGKYISEGSYISWFVDIELHKNTNVKDRAKYAIFLNGSPSTNNIGIHYHPMHYVEKTKVIKLFSIDKTSSEFKKYNDTLQDFIDDITYFEK